MFLNNLYCEDPHFSAKGWRPMNRRGSPCALCWGGSGALRCLRDRFGNRYMTNSCGDTFINTPNYAYIFNVSAQGI